MDDDTGNRRHNDEAYERDDRPARYVEYVNDCEFLFVVQFGNYPIMIKGNLVAIALWLLGIMIVVRIVAAIA